jgi:hypothetical protein
VAHGALFVLGRLNMQWCIPIVASSHPWAKNGIEHNLPTQTSSEVRVSIRTHRIVCMQPVSSPTFPIHAPEICSTVSSVSVLDAWPAQHLGLLWVCSSWSSLLGCNPPPALTCCRCASHSSSNHNPPGFGSTKVASLHPSICCYIFHKCGRAI